MKKNLIIQFLLLSLFPTLPVWADEAIAYDYEGYPTIIHSETDYVQTKRPKFWCLHVDTEDGGFINLDYRLAGDTLIQEEHYVRVVFGYEKMADLYENDFILMSAIRPDGYAHADTLYYRQEGDKVYCLQPEENKKILIIDYGLELGDEFTDANGEIYVVKEIGKQSNEKHFFGWYFYQPKRLILVSRKTGEEDIWIEGLGSTHWGITPHFIMTRNKVFTKLGLQPSHAHISMGYGGNLLLEPNVNTECYKAKMIDLGGNYYGDNIFANYEFLGDTLRIEGVKVFKHFAGYSYAECILDNGRIDVMIKRFSMEDVKREERYIFDVKIPGFKAGTYEVGMPGQEYVTLVCKGEAKETVSFTKNQMATIILPTEPDASKGKYYRLDRCEDGKIIFTEETQPKAKVPYIIIPNEDFSIDLSSLDLEGLTQASVSVGGVSFIGSYSHAEYNCEEGYYIDIIDKTPDCHVDDVNLRKATIGALRAYLKVNWDDPYGQGPTKGVRDMLEIVLEDNPNSIGNEELRVKNEELVDTVYDLQGRRLSSKPTKGLYIQNGKKIMVK